MALPPLRRPLTVGLAGVAAALLIPAGLAAAGEGAAGIHSAGSTSTADNTDNPPGVSIPEIQGQGHISPYAGSRVATTGVVTARKFDGFWLQDANGDEDPRTSDGVFVFAGRDGALPEVGESVQVTAMVTERRPDEKNGPNLAVTELAEPDTAKLDEQLPSPKPVAIGANGRTAPAQNADDETPRRTDVEAEGAFRPQRDAIDFYETLEGMMVQVSDPEVVGPTSQYGELTVLPPGSDAPRNPAGGALYAGYDGPNTQRLTVDDEIIYDQMPDANVGDRLGGTVAGPLHYDFATYRMYPTEVPTVEPGGRQREHADPANNDELAVSTFNVENLDPTDPQRQFNRLARIVVDNLAAPDVLTLEEIQDNTGAECPDYPDDKDCTPDGVVEADKTLDKLTTAIRKAGGADYAWRQISPENLADGGEPTGNIRNAFLFRTDRGLDFVDRPGGDATTATGVRRENGKARLTHSPGRIDPTNPEWAETRKSLAGEFTWRGEPIIVIANHFASKGDDEPIMGRWQPPYRVTEEEEREPQAEIIRDFVRKVERAQPRAKVIVAGDINDFQFSETTQILQDRHGGALPALHPLANDLPTEERYSYVFEGNSQVLDQILVSPGLYGVPPTSGHRPSTASVTTVDSVHVNAEFADQVSDHDPQLAHFRLAR